VKSLEVWKKVELRELKSLYDHLNKLREGYAERELKEILSRPDRFYQKPHRLGIWSRLTRIFPDPEYFVKKVSKLKSFTIPVFAIITPFELGKDSPGAIYWIVLNPNANNGVRWVTRTTYGYGGTGPHQSAVILEFFEKRGIPIEARTGDYLLRFLGG